MLFDESGTRYKIFLTIVQSRKMLTLTEISSKLRLSPQNIAYHLPFLEETGLIIHSDGMYFCQPILIDDSLRKEFSDTIHGLVEMMGNTEAEIVVTGGCHLTNGEVVINCLKSLISLSIPDV